MEDVVPWKERDPMSERLKFVARIEAGESMSESCRDFQTSRKTGYKIVERFRAEGADALIDRSRSPKSSPWRIRDEIVQQVLAERRAHPTGDRGS